MFYLSLQESDTAGHSDLSFEFPALGLSERLDTYYFALAIEPKSGSKEIKKAIALLLQSWKSRLNKLIEGETIYLPIDFSDQYIACLEVSKNSELEINYGFTQVGGYAVNPINANNFFDSVKDFKPTVSKSIKIPQSEFVSRLDLLIRKFYDGN